MQLRRTLFIFLIITLFSSIVQANENSDKALNFYHDGISAKTIHERTIAFEKSLELYLTQFNESKAQGTMNGMLCYNIGNCYFNLGQIGYAIFYYKMGLKLIPDNETLKENLRIAIEKRKYPIDIETNAVIETLLFFHYKISTSHRINYLIIFSWAASVFFLLLIYRSRTVFIYLFGVTITCVFCLSGSLLFEYYTPDHCGVIIQTANIRKDRGQGFAPITPRPLGEGSIVKVLSLENEWYKIIINDNKTGFVKKEFLKLII